MIAVDEGALMRTGIVMVTEVMWRLGREHPDFGVLLDAIERIRAALPAAPSTPPPVIEVRVPFIPDAVNETRRRHWSSSAAKTAKWRDDARLLGLEAVQTSGIKVPFLYGDAEITFLLDAARGDLDNLLASSKPLVDGIRDAGVIRDDSVRMLPRISLGWQRSDHRGVVFRIREATF